MATKNKSVKKSVKKEAKKVNFLETLSKFGAVGRILIIPIILGLFLYLVWLLGEDVKKDPLFYYDSESIVLVNGYPDWTETYSLVNDDGTQKIKLIKEKIMKEVIGKSFFSKTVLKKLKISLSQNGWVREVSLIKKYPNKINVSLTLREPKAAVLYGDYWRWIDEEGVLLPVKEHRDGPLVSLFRVSGDYNLKSPTEGNIGSDPSIKKAQDLYELISNTYGLDHKLEKIEIRMNNSFYSSPKSPKYYLFFKNGLEVKWGAFLDYKEVDGFPGKHLNSQEKVSLMLKKIKQKPNRLHIDVEFRT